jgi:hypothetical protein
MNAVLCVWVYVCIYLVADKNPRYKQRPSYIRTRKSLVGNLAAVGSMPGPLETILKILNTVYHLLPYEEHMYINVY